MPHENVHAIDALLRTMPREDRLGCLVMAIIDADSNALEVALRMVWATKEMSKGLGETNRFRVADQLRNVADRLEREHAHVS
jgi:hypothetical protein